jgi:hypothetical protein
MPYKDKEKQKLWYLNNKEKMKLYYLNNIEKKKQYDKEWILNNKEKKKQYDKKWRLNNKEHLNQYKKQWNLNNKEKNKRYQKKYYLKKKEKLNQYQKEWRLNNRKHIRKYENKYFKKRRETDPNFKLLRSIRTRILKALKRNHKSKSTIKLLGCSIEECWQHLESKFQPGMTKENHGKWHIDHIKPCISFNLTDPEQQKICFHYTNLQPLWAEDNLKKGAKYD